MKSRKIPVPFFAAPCYACRSCRWAKTTPSPTFPRICYLRHDWKLKTSFTVRMIWGITIAEREQMSHFPWWMCIYMMNMEIKRKTFKQKLTEKYSAVRPVLLVVEWMMRVALGSIWKLHAWCESRECIHMMKNTMIELKSSFSFSKL